VTQDEQRLANAIKELRAHFQESQQQFSNRLGVTVRTVARYELEKPPPSDMLAKLASIAANAGRKDLAMIFALFRLNEVMKTNNAMIQAYQEEMASPLPDQWRALGWLTAMGLMEFQNRLDTFLREEVVRAVERRGFPLSIQERHYLGSLAQDVK
jgi:transcriptional regulator with XRE-family HTH domain